MNSNHVNRPARLTLLKLLVISAFALAVTLPFVKQPFSLDGALVVDFARAQAENPLQQHLDDFDYFGVRYDRFTNTHPRGLSLYLSLFIRVFGESEIPLHTAMLVFPVIGGISVYFLGRRFGVNGLAAALLFLAAPAVLVGAHTLMVDMPGTCLWTASLAAFIYGVDRNSRLLLALAAALFVMTIFIFYQGLSALGLALLYLAMKRRFSFRFFVPVIVPAAVFLAYLLIFHGSYGEFPRFSYRIPLPNYDKDLLHQFRGQLVIIGGALMMPLVMMFGFVRNWRIALAAVLAAAATWPWLIVRHATGHYDLYETLALGVFINTGITVLYAAVELAATGFIAWFKKRNNDALLPVAWFLGVFAYCVFFLGYPSPRYFLPATPALVLLMLMVGRRPSGERRYLRAALGGAALGLTLAYALAIAVGYLDYANEGKDTAAWVAREYGDEPGRIWFSGELGFAYYMRRNGYTMSPGIMWDRYSQTDLPRPEDLPAAGDIIVLSPLSGGSLPYPDVIPFLRPEENHKTWSSQPVVVWSYQDTRSSWGVSLLLPFTLTGTPVAIDDVTVWRVSEDPAHLTPEARREIDRWR